MRGYFGIGIENSKIPINVGSLWRSGFNFGASFIFTIGQRYKAQKSDTTKAWRSIPFYQYEDFAAFKKSIPKDCNLVGVELDNKAHQLFNFCHPERSIYLLGAEDCGLSQDAINLCRSIVYIPTPYSINVAVAGSIVMYDRISKGQKS